MSIRWISAGALVALTACPAGPPPPVPESGPAPAASSSPPPPAMLPSAAAIAPALRQRLVDDPYAFFRFVNLSFTERVCQLFASRATTLPTVNLHGDAHVEQFAAVSDFVGLLDFDDASLGPAVIDMVRFGVSLELACRAADLGCGGAPLDAFLRGYRRGIEAPEAEPARDGEVLRRMRARVGHPKLDLLAWFEAHVEALPEARQADVMAGYGRYVSTVRARHPELSEAYFELKRFGGFRGGVGSAHVDRLFARIEGTTEADDDDLVLEFKELRDLSSVSCVVARKGDALRVVIANSRLGGRDDEFLAIVPRGLDESVDDRPWWGQSWDERYTELDVERDVRGVADLEEVAFASGQQLGRGHCVKVAAPFDEELRREQRRMLDEHEDAIRDAVRRLTNEVLAAHRAFVASAP